LQALKNSIPELNDKQRLRQKINEMSARHQELEQQIRELKQRQHFNDQRRAQNEYEHEKLMVNQSQPKDIKSHRTIPITVHLQQKNVLCVGGRSGNVASYRDLIERVGGHFAHHDGGMEDSQSLLDSSLAAADLVICQTGCISHNAYWRVKEFCKRTGKRCVFVENPSVSSLARGLEQATEELSIASDQSQTTPSS
jgi:hypothetical protein